MTRSSLVTRRLRRLPSASSCRCLRTGAHIPWQTISERNLIHTEIESQGGECSSSLGSMRIIPCISSYSHHHPRLGHAVAMNTATKHQFSRARCYVLRKEENITMMTVQKEKISSMTVQNGEINTRVCARPLILLLS